MRDVHEFFWSSRIVPRCACRSCSTSLGAARGVI